MEHITRLVVAVLEKYLLNPKRQNDLNLSSWFIILKHATTLIQSKAGLYYIAEKTSLKIYFRE